MDKTYICYHHDLDGSASVVIAKQFFKRVIPHPCDYQNVDKLIKDIISPKACKNKRLLILDICPSKETCEAIETTSAVDLDVTLIDHHIKKRWVEKYHWAVFSNDACGASLTLQHLEKTSDTGLKDHWRNRAYGFAKAVDAYDRWLLRSEHRERGERLNLLHRFLGTERFIDIFTNDFDFDGKDLSIQTVGVLRDNEGKYVQKVIKSQLRSAEYQMDGFGNRFKILFANEFTPQVGHAALNDSDSEDLHYVAVVCPTENRCSLYSRKDGVDVGQIAVLLGGGGHREASGFHLKITNQVHRQVFKVLNTAEPIK